MKFRQGGFTLIEIAIVLLIVVILLGYTVAMFPVQQELKQYRKADADMESIIEHLIAYAQVRGRLPCPDSDTDGLENSVGGTDCTAYYGLVPGRTLGIDGKYSAAGVLIDPWGQGYRYAIADTDFSLDGEFDLVTANEIREEGINNVVPSLFLCEDSNVSPNDADTTCADVSGAEVIANVAVVIISMGKDFAAPTSNIEAENIDDFLDGTNDHVYIFAARRDDYDDIVKWISPNLLFSKMIEADQLP